MARRAKTAAKSKAATVAKASGREIERVLALDTSSVAVGWALFEDGELTRHGKFRQKGDQHGEKLSNFHNWLIGMCRQHEPHQLVYERPFAGRRRNAFAVLQLYVAVLLSTHWEEFGCELPDVNSVPAREVKRRNRMRKGRDHKANKKIAVLLANRLYKLRLKYKENDKTKSVSDDDVADAILLGRAWLLAERPMSQATDDEEA